jgi:hypothetical protein
MQSNTNRLADLVEQLRQSRPLSLEERCRDLEALSSSDLRIAREIAVRLCDLGGDPSRLSAEDHAELRRIEAKIREAKL